MKQLTLFRLVYSGQAGPLSTCDASSRHGMGEFMFCGKDVARPPPLPAHTTVTSVASHPSAPSATKSIKNEQWANTLFGPKGLLTAVFHAVDDRNKADAPKAAHIQADLPAKPFDFAKIFDALLMNSQKGDFDEPIPELPEFFGICNRLSCGDIFKALDQFKKSEFFSNFQTALQLIQDPKGWDIIGELLSKPELIASFTGGQMPGLENIFGSALGKPEGENGAKENKPKQRPGDILPGDGDLGTDYSSLVDERPPELQKVKKPNAIELPEIAENVDGGTEDYYSAVSGGGDEYVETIEKVEKIEKTKPTAPPVKERMELPEISESIDGPGEEIDGMETITVDEKIESVLPSPTEKKPSFQRRFVTVEATSTTTRAPVTRAPLTTRKPFVITTRIPTTTTKNFRKEDDYYSMYYD
uniref:EH domain-containing protein n=1 Tax=Steinernema glaseri TaxID=37863 RepID=A0A1I7YLC6_9BILA